MKIPVLLFASLRERIGSERAVLELSPGSRVREVFDCIFSDVAEREMWRKAVRVAVNRAYVSLDTVLQETDEVALIPPVAGG